MSDERRQAERPEGDQLLAVLDAVIFASDEPVRAAEIAEAFDGLAGEEVEFALGQLEQHYAREGIGLRLERVAGGYRLATRPEIGAFVRQFFRQRNRTRLSVAALETLAIAAYRQPITAPEIQAIRGKDPSAAIKGLLDRKLLRILGRKRVVGNPLLYGTTQQFLVHFGMNDLSDLPSIEEFEPFLDTLMAQAEAGGDAGPAVEAPVVAEGAARDVDAVAIDD